MSQATLNRRAAWPTWVVGGLLACVMILVVYVLTLGPVFRMAHQQWISWPTYETYSAPANLVGDSNLMIGNALGTYLVW